MGIALAPERTLILEGFRVHELSVSTVPSTVKGRAIIAQGDPNTADAHLVRIVSYGRMGAVQSLKRVARRV